MAGWIKTGLLVCLLLLMMIRVAAQSTSEEVTVQIIQDVQYYDGDDADPIRHTLDIYMPEDESVSPVVMYVHGGAWVGGSKNGYANIGQALAKAGYRVVIVNYRLSPAVTHPAHVEDLARAFAWTVDNIAVYGGDPEHMILTGHSAGGHMVSLLSLQPEYLAAVNHSPEDIRAVLAFSGVFVIDDWIMGWAKGAFPDDDQARMEASPLHQVHGDVPPFLLVASEHDYSELLEETEAMKDALQEVDVSVETVVIPNRDHFSLVTRIGTPDDPTTEFMLGWVDGVLATSD